MRRTDASFHRFSWARAIAIAEAFVDALPRHAVHGLTVVGSVRRLEPFVGDIDLVIACEDRPAVARACVSHRSVVQVIDRRAEYLCLQLRERPLLDVWLVAPENQGAAVWLYTGPRDYTRRVRERALQHLGIAVTGGRLIDSRGNVVVATTELIAAQTLGIDLLPAELRQAQLVAGFWPTLTQSADGHAVSRIDHMRSIADRSVRVQPARVGLWMHR